MEIIGKYFSYPRDWILIREVSRILILSSWKYKISEILKKGYYIQKSILSSVIRIFLSDWNKSKVEK